jgi:hypothetical protein
MEQITGFPDLNKRSMATILLIFVSVILYGQQCIISVPFEFDNFRIEKADSLTSVLCVENKDIRYPMPVGYPELPYIPFYVLLPHNAIITGISIEEVNFNTLEGNYRIALKSVNENNSDSSGLTLSDALIINQPDSGSEYFPSDVQGAVYDLPQLYAGFLLDRIFICPFRYNERQQQLLFCNKMEVKIIYQIKDEPLKYESSPEKIAQSREFIREMVINTGEIIKILPLEEKIDYSRVPVFKKVEENLKSENKVNTKGNKQEKSAEPFYIKHIETK